MHIINEALIAMRDQMRDAFAKDDVAAVTEIARDVPHVIDALIKSRADLIAMTAAVHEYFAADAALNEAFANTRFAAPDMARQMAEEHARAIVRAQTARRALREMAGMKR